MRVISILSLLSGIPTAMQVSHGTDRLLGLDLNRDDKVLAKLKEMDPGGSVVAASSQLGGFVLSNTRGPVAQLWPAPSHRVTSDIDDRGALTRTIRKDVS
jgi:hypothetical protein